MSLISKLFNWRKKKRDHNSSNPHGSQDSIINDSIIEEFTEAIESELGENNGHERNTIIAPIRLYPLEINDDDIFLDELLETNKNKPIKESYKLKDAGYTPRQNYLEDTLISEKFSLCGNGSEYKDMTTVMSNLDKILVQDWNSYNNMEEEDIKYLVRRLREKGELLSENNLMEQEVRPEFRKADYNLAYKLSKKFKETAINLSKKYHESRQTESSYQNREVLLGNIGKELAY